MKFLASLLLLGALFSSAQSYKEVPEFTVTGLLPYQGMSMTIYLVSSGNSFLGTGTTINRVFQTLDNRMIVESEVTLDPKVEARSSYGVKPNSIVVVIHPAKKHALNKLDSTLSTGAQFKEPIYSRPQDKVPATEENKQLLRRKTVELEDLRKEGIIKF